MKQLKYIFYFILIIIILPSICTKKKEKKKEEEQNVVAESQENTDYTQQYDYSKYNTVKLCHLKTSQVEEIPLDEYLYGVVSAEMPANYELEALKAQSIVARTYTIYQIENSRRKA